MRGMVKLNMAGLAAEILRDEYHAARMAVTLAVGKFTGQELADGRIWRRICYDCGAIQPEANYVNHSCACGCNVVLWEPKP